jgi:FKBP-type peptidyl-prolyl cis-trans isomerase FklB
MKHAWISAVLVLVIPFLACAQAQETAEPQAAAQDASTLTTEQKASYAIGYNLGKSLGREEVDIDSELLVRGFKDSASAAQPLISEAEMQQVMASLQQQMATRNRERAAAQAATNKTQGEAFLAENKGKAGISTTASGLQYQVLTEGTGPIPQAGDTVVVHYRGTLLDGTQFDSSHDRGQPATFPVTGVIPGWVEALQLMKVGSKWKLFIPSALAYGERGSGPVIGPNATLLFEVELLEIKAKE